MIALLVGSFSKPQFFKLTRETTPKAHFLRRGPTPYTGVSFVKSGFSAAHYCSPFNSPATAAVLATTRSCWRPYISTHQWHLTPDSLFHFNIDWSSSYDFHKYKKLKILNKNSKYHKTSHQEFAHNLVLGWVRARPPGTLSSAPWPPAGREPGWRRRVRDCMAATFTGTRWQRRLGF